MFGVLIYDILFFTIPIILIALFGVCLYRYIIAKRKNKKKPGTFSDNEVKLRFLLLILTFVMMLVFVSVVVGFIALLYMAVAFM